MLKTLLPALAVLLAVRSGPARTPDSPQLLELESRVEELERKFQTRLARVDICGEQTVDSFGHVYEQLEKIRGAMNALHGSASPFSIDLNSRNDASMQMFHLTRMCGGPMPLPGNQREAGRSR